MGAVQQTLRRVLRTPRAAEASAAAPLGLDRHIIDRVRPYTMTSDERLQALIDGVRYVVGRGVPGAFAECGVWRGGSVLAMLLTLQEEGSADRDVYLFDTFEGMTAPTEHDVSALDPPALETWQQAEGKPWSEFFDDAIFNEDQVRETLRASGYPEDKLHLVRGPVEQTLPQNAPRELALLRLDTDWYESTRHELEHLYPRLAEGGVLIIDDYGHWDGARRAVDEYFAATGKPLLLNRIDYTGRVAIKH
jgi:O-methyltransferase